MEIYEIMLVSPGTVKAGGYVTNDVTDGTIGASIREAQDIHLKAIIGSALLERLQELVYNKMMGLEDNIDSVANAEYKHLLDRYIERYMVKKVESLLCLPISLKIRNMGVIQNSDQNVNRSSVDDIYVLQRRFETGACRFATELSMYLCKEKAKFAELDAQTCNCGGFVPPMLGKRFVNVPLGLDNSGITCC